jgi:hypothetical protein
VKVKVVRNEGIQISLLSKRLFKEGRASIMALQTLLAQAQVVFDRSQYYCPVDTGLLKGTAFIQGHFRGIEVGRESHGPEPIFPKTNEYGVPTETQYQPEVRIVYPQDYAVFVHENQDSWHTPPTGAKFLSRAAAETRDEIEGVGAEAWMNVARMEFRFSAGNFPQAPPDMSESAYGTPGFYKVYDLG